MIRGGYVNPVIAGGVSHYSFSDLLILRTAGALRQADVPQAKIKAALRSLSAMMPGISASALAAAPTGRQVAVREGNNLFEYESGQYALPLFAPTSTLENRSTVPTPLRDRPAAVKAAAGEVAAVDQIDGVAANAHFDAGLLLEDVDAPAARRAYEDCLRTDAEHLDARINLGRMLHLSGNLEEAERVYRAARYPSATLLFNFAVLLEDLQRVTESIEQYRHALSMDPRCADAHFNLARLHELQSRPQEALRHLLAYKRLLAATSHSTSLSSGSA